MEATTLTSSQAVFDLEDEDTQKDKYLSFIIGRESYGLDIRHVTEIVVMQNITEVPDMPEYIKGVINLRGSVFSVMDIRNRFHLESADYTDRTCIIIVRVDDQQIGLIVDTVNEVVDIPENVIEPMPNFHTSHENNYILGMGKLGNKVIILLDVEKILYNEERSSSPVIN
ncbi:chemotaxis protein CheW [bacterium]|nr:chemotaxis protein CheW [bacterium]